MKEEEIGTLLLDNDKNSVIVNYLLSYLSKGLSKDFEILSWCAVGPVLPHGEKVPL